jgi:RNA polymerase-binding transcription factor DksA
VAGLFVLQMAQQKQVTATLSAVNTNGDEAAIAGKTLEDGSATYEKEQTNQLAARQKKFVDQLAAALMRIQNKTYGACWVTSKLIPAERLLRCRIRL